MRKIILACAGGFSTGMLAERMIEECHKRNMEREVIAISETNISQHVREGDIILLGPQVAHLEDQLQKKYGNKGVIVKTIEIVDFGMMDAGKVLDKIFN